MVQGGEGKGGGGGLQPLSWDFAMLEYLENISPLIDSLSCALQDKVNNMGFLALLGARDPFKMTVKITAILDSTKSLNLSGKQGNCKYILLEL